MTAQKTAIVRVCTTRLEMTNSLRGGTPMAKALLLTAIKRHDLHPVIPVLSDGHAVTKGRGVDSTAVRQALLLQLDDPAAASTMATALLKLAASYRPLADLTILVTDHTDRALARAQHRDHRVFTHQQATLMHAANAPTSSPAQPYSAATVPLNPARRTPRAEMASGRC